MTIWHIDLNNQDGKIKNPKIEFNLTELESLKTKLSEKENEVNRLNTNVLTCEDTIGGLNSRIEALRENYDNMENNYNNLRSQNTNQYDELSSLKIKLNNTQYATLPTWLTYEDIVKNNIIILPFNDYLWLFKKMDIQIKNIRFNTTNSNDKIYPLKGVYNFPKNSYVGLCISKNYVQKDGIFLIDNNYKVSYYNTAHSVDGNNALCATYKKRIESIKDYLHAIFYIKMEFGIINLSSPYGYYGFTTGFKKIFNKIIIEAIQFAPPEAMSGNYLTNSTGNRYYGHINRSDLRVIEENDNSREDEEGDEDDDDGYYDED